METRFTWYAPEHEWTERSPDWYWWFGTIGAIAVAGSIWFQNYLLAALLAISTALFIIFNKREPGEHVVVVTDEWIMVDSKKYLFRELDGFWVADPLDHSIFGKLMLHIPNGPVQLHTYLIDVDVEIAELRDFLRTKITEKEYKPNQVEILFDKYL